MWVEKTLGLCKARIQFSATVLSLGMFLKPQPLQSKGKGTPKS